MARPTGISAEVSAEAMKPATVRSVRAFCRRRFEETFEIEWPRGDGDWILLRDFARENDEAEKTRLFVENEGKKVLRAILRLRAACSELATAGAAAQAVYEEVLTALYNPHEDIEPVEAFLPDLSRVLGKIPKRINMAIFDGVQDVAVEMTSKRARIVANIGTFTQEYSLTKTLGPRELSWIGVLAGVPIIIRSDESIKTFLNRERENYKKLVRKRR